jgi:hypothetical protein
VRCLMYSRSLEIAVETVCKKSATLPQDWCCWRNVVRMFHCGTVPCSTSTIGMTISITIRCWWNATHQLQQSQLAFVVLLVSVRTKPTSAAALLMIHSIDVTVSVVFGWINNFAVNAIIGRINKDWLLTINY